MEILLLFVNEFAPLRNVPQFKLILFDKHGAQTISIFALKKKWTQFLNFKVLTKTILINLISFPC